MDRDRRCALGPFTEPAARVNDTRTTTHPCTHMTRVGAAECGHCPVHDLALFSDLRGKEAETVHGRIDHYVYPPGAALYNEDGPADFVFTVRRGLVKLVDYAANGSERILRIHGRGDVIGLEAIARRRYRHGAVSIGEVEVCRIPASVLHALGTTSPDIVDRLNERWEQTVEKADYWITAFSTGSVRVRVARLLLYLAEMQGRAGGRGVELLGGHDMAAIVGTTAESFSRELSVLRRGGALKRGEDHSYDCDIGALERMIAE